MYNANLEFLIKFTREGVKDWQVVTVPYHETFEEVMVGILQWYQERFNCEIVLTDTTLIPECYYE
jgi:hypothetical protein